MWVPKKGKQGKEGQVDSEPAIEKKHFQLIDWKGAQVAGRGERSALKSVPGRKPQEGDISGRKQLEKKDVCGKGDHEPDRGETRQKGR